MAEEEVDSESGRGDLSVAKGPDPENGRGGAAVRLQKIADEALEKNLQGIVNCILNNIRGEHLPSVKLLFELAARLKAEENVPESEYRSLADSLWKSKQELDKAEQEIEELISC